MFKEARFEKPWTAIDVDGKQHAGLTKELYDSLRKLGGKAKEPRRALEYIVRSWETKDPEDWKPYILQIISQHNDIMSDLSTDRGIVNAP